MSPSAGDDRVNILLVDDQPARLLSYEAILGDLGQNLIRAGSGIEALEQVMRHEFAVILLDVSMPGMDGFETAALIHEHPRFGRTPIIFVTGFHVTDVDRLKGYELGAADYVYVPVVPAILRSKVAVLVELHQKRRELQQLNRRLERANADLAAANAELQAETTRELRRLNDGLARANGELERANAGLTAEVAVRRKAETRLRENEERLRAIVESTSAVIYQTDSAGRLVLANPSFEQVAGRRAAELLGLTVREALPGDASAAIAAHDAQVLAEGCPLQFEEMLELADGPHTYASVKAPVREADGRVCGVVSVATDITFRKHLERALREADRRKDEFLAMLAHELRNPLAPILSAAKALRPAVAGDADSRWCVEAIERQAGQLARLVEDLLDVSRITQGKIRLRREPVDVAAVLELAAEASGPLISGRGHELTIAAPQEPLRVHGDLARLAQAVGNLLNNAAKYTPDGGRIRLEASCEAATAATPGQVLIRVTDTGAGIGADLMPMLFELFSQGERTRARSQGGLGIGLALVRRVAELHGGSVAAHSDGEDRGSEFVIRLPLLDRGPARGAGDPGAAPPEAASEHAAPNGALRVVVADDNADAARSLALILRRLGHVVRTARDGVEAVEVCDAFDPDVALLDIGMPRLDGNGAAERLREGRLGRRIGLVALTGWGQEETRTRTRQAGFDAHLVKPVDVAELTRVLTSLGHRARDGNGS